MVFLDWYPLLASLASMATAQILKNLSFLIRYRTMSLKYWFTSGGMPSSHSALVIALTVALGLKEGWNSNVFFISAVFSLIVLYDAAGVRRMVGKQSAILNQISEEIEISHKPLSELLGHTPLEVGAGAVLGAMVACGLFWVLT